MIWPRWFWLALLPACVLPASAIAQITQFTPPNDNELRSAYCMSLLKSWIELAQSELAKVDAMSKGDTTPSSPSVQDAAKDLALAREGLAKAIAAHDRLRAYLLPKMMVLDPVAMGLAMKRGEADWQEYWAMLHRCDAKCLTVPMPSEDQAKACWSSCADAALIARIQACPNPTWLPF